MTKSTIWKGYKPSMEAKATLRLYLNDPEIIRQFKVKGNKISFNIPLEIEGKLVIGETEEGTKHHFFVHSEGKEGFIPVFIDIKDKGEK